jgi:S-adenosylmethionine:tRNA ribosyltransferase-isomerase
MSATDDQLSAYEYDLPPELIAQSPAERREDSRLLVMNRVTGNVSHRRFSELPGLLHSGDLLVLNNTRVVPARLIGFRKATGGKWEGLFLKAEPSGEWRLIGQTRGTLKPGELLVIPSADQKPPLELELIDRHAGGEWTARCLSKEGVWEVLSQYGRPPLPPYIERDSDEPTDIERYQTVFASQPGAVAAPTAGLHFTPELLQACRDRGVQTAFVTLHVGLGTFRPVAVDDLSQHVMHDEWAELSEPTAVAVRETRARGGRVIAVGTTSVRTLESASSSGEVQAWSGETNLFIRPPYRFRSVDGLITNFHLPRSTLLMLVSAFAGREPVLHAYAEAITQRYRFFSYGDAMFLSDDAYLGERPA